MQIHATLAFAMLIAANVAKWHLMTASRVTMPIRVAVAIGVRAGFPPPCGDDNPCVCAQTVCAMDGDDAGQCVAAYPIADGSNNSAATAMPVDFDGSVVGEFGGDGDSGSGWYVLTFPDDLAGETAVELPTKTAAGTGMRRWSLLVRRRRSCESRC